MCGATVSSSQPIAVSTRWMSCSIERTESSSARPCSAVRFRKFGTAGTPYLGAAAEGVVYNPTNDFWVNLAGNASLMPFINWLVVAGEIAIGVALIFGLFTRFAAVAGTLMMALFFVAAWNF